MSELTLEQRIEMGDEVRRLHSVGDAQAAAVIKIALADDRYFMGLVIAPLPEAKQPKKSAKKEAWVQYALNVSDIDPEIINSATRTDVINMLKVNGFIE
jgi:hypothetical protein